MIGTAWSVKPEGAAAETTARSLGELLMGSFLLPFETAAVLLLVAVMGAALIARKN